MTAHPSRAVEARIPAGRADSLRWVLGSLCAGLGALILVAPHRFSSPLLATATGLRQVWGTAALLGGVALLAAAALRPRRPLLVATHVFAAGTLLALGATASASPATSCRASSPFLQGQRAPGQGGLGIGLTLVKSFVELHGGRVHAKSDGPGRGSELEVRLPTSGPALLVAVVTTSS